VKMQPTGVRVKSALKNTDNSTVWLSTNSYRTYSRLRQTTWDRIALQKKSYKNAVSFLPNCWESFMTIYKKRTKQNVLTENAACNSFGETMRQPVDANNRNIYLFTVHKAHETVIQLYIYTSFYGCRRLNVQTTLKRLGRYKRLAN